MALWNDQDQGDYMEDCPVCLVKVCKKRLTMHVFNCAKKHEAQFEEMELIRCPLYKQHIIPKQYLNHHLEGNCEAALNLLRRFFQEKGLIEKLEPVPDDYLQHIPDELLNKHNKRLLYHLNCKPDIAK